MCTVNLYLGSIVVIHWCSVPAFLATQYTCMCLYLLIFNVVVPTPSVTVTAPNTQTVGQPLTLTCNVTTVRGITSRVEIVWSRGNNNERTTESSIPTTTDSSLIYLDTYSISSLRTEDDSRLYECRVVIHTSPVIMVNDTTRLNVIGMCFVVQEKNSSNRDHRNKKQ